MVRVLARDPGFFVVLPLVDQRFRRFPLCDAERRAPGLGIGTCQGGSSIRSSRTDTEFGGRVSRIAYGRSRAPANQAACSTTAPEAPQSVPPARNGARENRRMLAARVQRPPEGFDGRGRHPNSPGQSRRRSSDFDRERTVVEPALGPRVRRLFGQRSRRAIAGSTCTAYLRG